MSSDSFADLGDSLAVMAQGLLDLLDANQRPAPGSLADKEAEGEPFAGDWGAHPGRDVFATVLMESWSCADHLRLVGEALSNHKAIASLYTLTRAVAETASIACYLTDPGIEPLERVRRNMNHNLKALSEDLNMLSRFTTPEARAREARHTNQVEAIRRTGQHFGLQFTKADRMRAARLGSKTPDAMTLIDQCASSTAGVGALYQQLLSSVAHGQLHGLTRFLICAPVSAPPGKVITQMNITDRDAALHLFAGPLCVSTLVKHLRWFFGWDTADLDPAVQRMLATWARLAAVRYSGPDLSATVQG